MDDRRNERRKQIDIKGYLNQDGLITELKLRDTNSRGVGAFSRLEFKPGQQGILHAQLDGMQKPGMIPIEVCWCLPDPMADDKYYPFRVGLRILAA